MRNILRNIGNEMSLMLRRPCAVITWLAMCFFVLWNFINNVNTAADHHFISQMYDIAYITTLSMWSKSGFFLMTFYPVLVVLPTATSFFNDTGSRMRIYIEARSGKSAYYFSKFAAVFFSTFIIFTVPFVAELIISFICLPASAHGDPSNFELYKTAVEIYDYPFSELFINNRFLWLLLAVVLFGMVSGVLAVFNAAVSSSSKIKYAIFTMISVYILLNICSTFQSVFSLEYLTNYFLILRLFERGKNYMAYAMTLVVLICFSVGIMTAHIKKDELI